jgi:hypothetical protein
MYTKDGNTVAGLVCVIMVALLWILNGCSGGEFPPDKQRAKQLVEGNLRRIGTPVKNINILDSAQDERSYCFNWNADWVWHYPKSSNQKKVYGYVRFMKTAEGWKYDHLNYKEGNDPGDPNLGCER